MRRLAIPFVSFLLVSPSFAADKTAEKYKPAIAALERWLDNEVALKKLPALSIALVDDQTVVWSRGFGYQDPHKKIAATGDTLYRVGSVSKPFTVLLLMLF